MRSSSPVSKRRSSPRLRGAAAAAGAASTARTKATKGVVKRKPRRKSSSSSSRRRTRRARPGPRFPASDELLDPTPDRYKKTYDMLMKTMHDLTPMLNRMLQRLGSYLEAKKTINIDKVANWDAEDSNILYRYLSTSTMMTLGKLVTLCDWYEKFGHLFSPSTDNDANIRRWKTLVRTTIVMTIVLKFFQHILPRLEQESGKFTKLADYNLYDSDSFTELLDTPLLRLFKMANGGNELRAMFAGRFWCDEKEDSHDSPNEMYVKSSMRPAYQNWPNNIGCLNNWINAYIDPQQHPGWGS